MMDIVFGLVSRTATYWTFFVAEEHGLFAAEELQVEPKLTGTTEATLVGLRDGTSHVAACAPDMTLEFIERGSELVIVGGVVRQQVSSVIVAPSIADFAMLRGQPIAIGASPRGTALLFREVLLRQGLRPGDYQAMSGLETTPAQVEGLRSGQVVAAMLSQPYDFFLMDKGFRRLALVSEVVPEYPFATLQVHRRWAAGHRGALVAFLRVMRRAGAWLEQAQHRAEAARILAEATSQPWQAAARTYDLFLGDAQSLALDARIAPAQLGLVQGLMVKHGTLAQGRDPEDYLDQSFWLEASRG